ncbi:sarcosine dehydrogenase, mitochondrial-like [Stegodyphus dumicola]|uniref:sarcosine dehydrogenase, mitochondrial-like n=1 Tax=Stegodyphus dumicola TaxID=202533 RepID=UPI0015B1C513|nr:sarcosine dehydrogenase, mitochondrial-like [Stegodyphus dumicola]
MKLGQESIKEEMQVGQEELKREITCIIENKFQGMEGRMDTVEEKLFANLPTPEELKCIVTTINTLATKAHFYAKSLHETSQQSVHNTRHSGNGFSKSELAVPLHIAASRVSCNEATNVLPGQINSILKSEHLAVASYRHWHADLRLDDTPLEAGLGFTCKLKTETPFLGRAALEKQKKEGLKKRLACFTIDEHIPLWGLEAIWRYDRVVGFLRRADYGFAIGKSIGYGYVTNPDTGMVSLDYLKSGTYHLESMGVKYPAQYHAKSPFDPNLRVKGDYSKPLSNQGQ